MDETTEVEAPDDLIGISEAAKLLGITTETVRVYANEGKVPVALRTTGGQRRFSRRALLALRDADGEDVA